MYYTYIYLDTRKPGCYKYDNYLFEFEPIYIGKGKNDRDKIHISRVIKNHFIAGKNPFYDKLNSILKLNKIPLILKLNFYENEKEALQNEKYLIELIGRKDLKTGTLLNLTEGGIGGDTFSNKTEEEKSKITEKRRNSMLGKNKGKQMSEEQKEYYRQLYTGKKNPEHSLRMKGKKLTQQHKDKLKGRKPSREEKEKQMYSLLKDKSIWDKQIIQMDLDKKEIKIWNNYRELKFDGNIEQQFISSIINICKKNKSGKCLNYRWKWKD